MKAEVNYTVSKKGNTDNLALPSKWDYYEIVNMEGEVSYYTPEARKELLAIVEKREDVEVEMFYEYAAGFARKWNEYNEGMMYVDRISSRPAPDFVLTRGVSFGKGSKAFHKNFTGVQIDTIKISFKH